MRLIALIMLILSVATAHTQSADAALKDLQSKVAGHRFVLKDFSAQSQMKYYWRDGHLDPEIVPLFKSVAIFEGQDVTLKGHTLTVQGLEALLVQDQDTNRPSLSSETWKATIKIELGSADPASVLSELRDRLFFPSVTSALNEIPDYLKREVPYRINSKGGNTAPCTTCKQWIRHGTWQEIAPNDPDYKHPVQTRGVNPQVPLNKEIKDVAGKTRFIFVVDEKGHPAEIWLTLAAGNGLHERYAYSMREQLFQSAMYHGIPVAVVLAEDFTSGQP